MNWVLDLGVLMLLVLLVFGIGEAEGYLHRSGRHVCTQPQTQAAAKQVFIESFCQPVFQPYFAMCDGGFRLCTRYRTVYSTSYRYRYSHVQRTDRYMCCPGWRTANNYASSCTEPICTHECRNGGRCLAPESCHCAAGWSGRTCDQAECLDACKNGGRCVAPNTCTCPRGWGGPLCSQATCTHECRNGGQCSAPETCQCAAGWSGRTCGLAECPDACKNGGQCVAPSTCTCPRGWGGPLCTKAVCFKQCQNDGECVGPDLCACPIGWSGKYCEKDIDECDSDYHGCQQLCKNTNGSFTCDCHEGFILSMDGKRCQVCLLCNPEFQELAGRVVELEKNIEEMREVKKSANRQDDGMHFLDMDMALNDQHISQIARISSLSEQISILEARLDDCTCTRYQNAYTGQQPSRRHSNKLKKKR